MKELTSRHSRCRQRAMAEPETLAKMKTFALIALVVLTGCATDRVESLTTLQGQTEAVVFQGRDSERKDGRKVSVMGLPEILARATWVEGQHFHKGGNWMRFADGREVFLPVGFEFFVVRDTPGHFEIRKEDHEQYRAIMQRIKKEINQAPGLTSRLRSAAGQV